MSAIDLGPRYEFVRELGSGGMARILLVRDLYLGKEVALKLFHRPPAGKEELEQVQKEFAILAGMEHPGVARAHDFGYLGDRPYFTSEFIPGEPLSARRTLVSGPELLRLAVDLSESLAFLHQSGLLHLDIKASNVILTRSGGRTRAVLIDFGLVRRGSLLPAGTKIRGSLPYMAPEYFRGGDLGPWTDVYALGVTLYRAATGAFPRPGASEARRRLDDESAWLPVPPPPSEVRPGSTPDLDRVILRCLALDPGARFSSGIELLAALQRAEGSHPAAGDSSGAFRDTVGRSAELARVEGFLEGMHLTGASPRTLLVTGPHGVGQSHFLRVLKIRAQTLGFRCYLETGYRGRPSPPGQLLRCLGAHMTRDGRGRWEGFLARLLVPRKPSRHDLTTGERRLRWADEVALAAAVIVEPLVLIVDGLEHFDEISVELLADLVRTLSERARPSKPSPKIDAGAATSMGVVIGLREEGPLAPLLRELADYLLQPGRSSVLTLAPLGLAETVELYRARRGAEVEGAQGLSIFQESGGLPDRIISLAGIAPLEASRLGKNAGRRYPSAAPPPAARAPSLDLRGRQILLALELLARPVASLELSRLTGCGRAEVESALVLLEKGGLAARDTAENGEDLWLCGRPSAEHLRSVSPAERRAVHLRIARRLAREARGEEDPRFLEAVRHYSQAGKKRPVVTLGLRAAAHLKSSFQHRAALQVYRAVLDAVPTTRRSLRLATTLEIADLHARLGDTDVEEGIQLLQEVLPQARRLPGAALERVLLRLAALHGRRGDFRRAEMLFSEGFGESSPASSRRGSRRASLGREELLLFTNEHAAMKMVVGEHEEALRLCEKGLRLAGAARSPEIREIILNLHATRASVASRSFRFDEAIRDLETAVEIAEAIGSPGNQATLLNNLGVVFSQCDRYQDAIRSFREAERICLRLDEGPSLASIYGNLSILHSRRGEFAPMEKALGEGERLIPGSIGRRQEFFLKHARGLCLLGRGRYTEAAAEFQVAIRLGEALGDRHLVYFDRIHRVEALAFEGSCSEAHEEMSKLSEPGPPAWIRKMALARRTYLEALLGRIEEAISTARRHAELKSERASPLLEAWDGLFLGWAFSLLEDVERSERHLVPAERFFRAHGLEPAASLLDYVRAEGFFLRGEMDRAWECLESQASPRTAGNDFIAVVAPLLKARVIAERAATSEDRSRSADLLAEAGAALVGNPLPEWAARLEATRGLLRSGAPQPGDSLRKALAGRLPEGWREAYLRSPCWRRWTSWEHSRRGKPPRTPRAPAMDRESSTTRAASAPPAGGGSLRSRLVVKSPGMRRLLAVLDRLRRVELPVLIQGETGTGKELIARVIHEESPRRSGPFEVVDCASLPSGLLESELFGVVAGAYTGVAQDRPGLLLSAQGGTVLLDEVGGAGLDLQAKLLRVLSAGMIRPVGGEAERRIDVRFLYSTSRDLEAEVREGRFRRDLLHRMKVVTVSLPPLRERPEDIEGLVRAILSEAGGPMPTLGRGIVRTLRRMEWPGNVRELKNVLARARLESPETITPQALERSLCEPQTSTYFPRNLLGEETLLELKDRLERDYIVFHLRRLHGDREALSQFLRLGRRQLYRRCAKLGIVLRKLRRGLGAAS